jgi:hypothetical protein
MNTSWPNTPFKVLPAATHFKHAAVPVYVAWVVRRGFEVFLSFGKSHGVEIDAPARLDLDGSE